jgi:hypothetical protein
MKIAVICGVAALAAAFAMPHLPAAAEAGIKQVQVQFPKGKTGTTIKGSIAGNQTVDYTLRAAAGQTMTVKLSGGSTVYHNVLPPGSAGEALFVGSRDGDTSTTTLPTSGQYTIRVYQMGNAKSSGKHSNFTLAVAIDGAAPASAGASKGGQDPLVEAAGRAGEGKFNATGKIPCAQAPGQPMGQCDFGVARAGGGTAAVSVKLPDGRKRMIMFQKGKATGADLSQADGNMKFSASKQADLYKIQAGNERYEIPEAVVSGG